MRTIDLCLKTRELNLTAEDIYRLASVEQLREIIEIHKNRMLFMLEKLYYVRRGKKNRYDDYGWIRDFFATIDQRLPGPEHDEDKYVFDKFGEEYVNEFRKGKILWERFDGKKYMIGQSSEYRKMKYMLVLNRGYLATGRLGSRDGIGDILMAWATQVPHSVRSIPGFESLWVDVEFLEKLDNCAEILEMNELLKK